MADADGLHVAFNEVHRVSNCETRCHHATRRIDVERDVLLGIFGFEKKKLANDDAGHVVFDFTRHEDNPVAEQSGIEIEGTLRTTVLFEDHRNQSHEIKSLLRKFDLVVGPSLFTITHFEHDGIS